jgi:hypothetical protein
VARLIRPWISVLAAIGAALALGLFLLFSWHNRKLATGVLRIPDLPLSVAEVQCRRLPRKAVEITCAFTIASRDFPKLLKGYRFEQLEWKPNKYQPFKYAHDFPFSLDLGESFEVVEVQSAALPKSDAPRRGYVELHVDKSRTHVLVHSYCEVDSAVPNKSLERTRER